MMNREIKFRARALHRKIWVYGHYYKDKGEHIIVSECNSWIYPDNEKFYPHTKIDVNTLGQYTGLKDDKGKEIYEGDIVLDTYTKQLLTVVFRDGEWRIENEDYDEALYDAGIEKKVVGNIYEEIGKVKGV